MKKGWEWIVCLFLLAGFSACKIDQGEKIAIVGAGPSGLTAAKYLTEKGFTDITVFEKNSYVGGKAYSYMYEGRPYDIGAVFTIKSYNEVEKLAKEFDHEIQPLKNAGFFDQEGNFTNAVEYMLTYETPFDWANDAFHFGKLLFLYPNLLEPEFTGTHKDLYQPIDDFLKLHPMGLYEAALPVLGATGMGFPSEIPAIYYLKLSLPIVYPIPNALKDLGGMMTGQGLLQVFSEGYQSLWQKVASTLNVKLNAKVTKVERNKKTGKITITAGGRTGVFDKLIVACPPDKALNFLDATEEEENLFKKIRYEKYVSTLFKTDKPILKTDIASTYENHKKENAGMVTGFIKQHRDKNVYVTYQYMEEDGNEAHLLDQLNRQVQIFGCEIVEIINVKAWENYPHVSPQDFADGFYERLDAMQGKNGTYYTSLTYGVNDTIKFTKHLIDQHAEW